ncbi:MAG: carboxymuconolactone decarboxylase family protein [Bacteroidetes bacterium]|nr:carboxymuconolactone decarboxylase family protein [Bacteroidota bacterium]
MTIPFKTTLPAQGLDSSDEKAVALLAATKQSMGMVPNMYANMANHTAMLETYSFGYKAFRQEGGFTPAEQEVVFMAVSYENGCNYCMGAHSFLADKMSGVPTAVTDAIREGGVVDDEKLGALHRFTSAMMVGRGRPSQAEVEEFLAAGYTERHILSIILAISVKTISNYSNHIFDTPLDAAFQSRAWEPALATV